ncbi:Capsular polysaccharide biosynthesis protein [Oceanobacillus limi]|uniref:Capsular polysaccharide biosynthesis protein n=1 Tax=Oceanobacillus limi TaxID=930131 RepID=A0A1I0A6M7_9BACI|nr:Wzz/FepE/Etk N-terminal domain-containing protein [Oceanobacillus limi]SES89335.1 Capsular polysaccharide biosynthesis protein [Oceanobacillus limi]
MKDTVAIQDIVQTLKKRMVFILFFTIGLIGVAAMLSYYFLNPVYESSSQFVVIQQKDDPVVQYDRSELETNLGLINTYSEIIKSPVILDQVIEEMGLTIPLDEFSKQIEVNSEENSQVVTVSAIADTPETAAQIANLVVEEFRDTILTVMQVENVFVLSNANPELSQEPIQPRPIMNMAIAGLIGLATSIGVTLLLEFLNTKVKTENDVEELGITVLGVISTIDKKRPSKNRNSKSTIEKEEANVET